MASRATDDERKASIDLRCVMTSWDMVGKGSSNKSSTLRRYLNPHLTLCDKVQRLHDLGVGSKNGTKKALQLNTSRTNELVEIPYSLLVYPKVGRRHLAQKSIDTFERS